MTTHNFTQQSDMTVLPAGLNGFELLASETAIAALPRVNIQHQIDLSDCDKLTCLPDNLQVGTLLLRNCTALEQLPEGLDVTFLDISGCTNLRQWPLFGRVWIGRFTAQGCHQLTQLPRWINNLGQLDLRGCTQLTSLPEELCVTGWLDIGDTQISQLPVGCQKAELRWNGVRITHRIAFAPETLSAEDVLAEPNTEVRRIMVERMGVERFVADAKPAVLDKDQDPGGPRRLLKIDLADDEPMVLLAVSCPSTERDYLLRVPPSIKSCHQAAAWIAGFDDPDDYNPLIET